MDSNILLFIIKLILGGIVCFFAILLMSKTRNISWMLIVIGLLFSYVYTIYDILCQLGILPYIDFKFFELPLIPLLGFLLPSCCFIASFLIKIFRRK